MLNADNTIDADQASRIAYHGAIFAYPMVLLDEARRRHPGAPNAFHYDWGGQLRCLAYPNPHVLYSTAWLDLSEGPVVLSTPKLNAHNMVIAMVDSRGRVFASAGARETGALPSEIAIVGPNWSGDIGRGLKAIRAATNRVWLIARTPIDRDDPQLALRLRRELYLTPIRRPDAPALERGPEPGLPGWPARDVASFGAEAFFRRFAGIIGERPASRHEATLIHELARIGFVPGGSFELDRLPPLIAASVEQGLARAIHTIATHPFAADPESGSPWAVYARQPGVAEDPLLLAALAHNALALNMAEDAHYFVAGIDADGNPLNGAHRYRLHFEEFRTPQVEGEWSLTAYDLNGDLPEPANGRFGLSSHDRLRFNADGSLDLRIQRDPPVSLLEPNWAPCPAGDFRLVLRAYWPRQSILGGAWRPPSVRRLHEQPSGFDARREAPQPMLRAAPSASAEGHPA